MQTLPNAITLITEPSVENQIVSVVCLFRKGARNELPAMGGSTNLLMRMLIRGTRSMDAERLHERIESLGAAIAPECEEDYSGVTMICLRRDLDEMLDILRQVIFEPSFDPGELEKEREWIAAAVRRKQDHSFSQVYEEFLKDLYEGHPYSQPVEGDPDRLILYTPEVLAGAHASVCRPDQMIVSVAGNVDTDSLAERLATWPSAGEDREMVMDASKTFLGSRYREIEKDRAQAFLVSGFVTCPWNDPDYPALRVASAALGEGMSSRMFVVLRDQQSLAYAVGSAHVPRFDKGHFFSYIGTSPEKIEDALRGISRQIDLLRSELLTDEELDRARNYIIGKFQLSRQTNLARARLRAVSVMAGLGLGYGDDFPERIRAITAVDVRRVAQRYFNRSITTVLRPGATAPAEE